MNNKKQQHSNSPKCSICKKTYPSNKLRAWNTITPGVSELIKYEHLAWQEGDFICRKDLSKYRSLYAQKLLEKNRDSLGELDNQVIASLESGNLVSVSPEDALNGGETFGGRMADRVARSGGSWTFILIFSTLLIVWMTLNVTGILFSPYDPYPFILLNLLLSCVAAMQAPIIMMSQRRQDTKDRVQAENEYRVNLKAELEIRQLNEKFDFQMSRQWERMDELHQIQIEILQERGNS